MDKPVAPAKVESSSEPAALIETLIGDDEKDHPRTETGTGNEALQSAALMKAFQPHRILLLIFGRLPFHVTTKKNGIHVFRFKKCSVHSIIFYISSLAFAIIFFMMIIGFGTFFYDINMSKNPITDRCFQTWEEFNLRRTAVPVLVTVTYLYLMFSGSLMILLRGKEYLHYLNYWNKAVSVMDMDPTSGVRAVAIKDNLACASLIIVFTISYASKAVQSLHNGASSIANSLVRLFIQDIGVSFSFSKAILEDFDCNKRKNGKVYLLVDYDTTAQTLWKLVGFLIQIYAIYSSLCFIIQFRFYCRLLRNIAYIWNERFLNCLHNVPEDFQDQTKRRLSYKYVMKDHLIVVQMFKLTESAFATILSSFYTVQLYFLSALKGTSPCDKLLNDISNSGDRQGVLKACIRLKPNEDTSQKVDKSKPFFSDPCEPSHYSAFQEGLTSLVLLAQTLRITIITSLESSNASEEAMRGCKILRRHCYMRSKSRKERNFIHSLIFSYAQTNPIQISAANYFVVGKSLLGTFNPGEYDFYNEYCVKTICLDDGALRGKLAEGHFGILEICNQERELRGMSHLSTS